MNIYHFVKTQFKQLSRLLCIIDGSIQSFSEVNRRIKTESIRKSSNINFSWTKIEYQNTNLNPIALCSTLFES